MSLKDTLTPVLSEEKREAVHRSFDVVGDIAIIQIPGPVVDKKNVIADAIQEQHSNVRTVLRKKTGRTGEYRTAEYEVVKGGQTETEHVEHGCRYRLDPTQVYFSPRLGTERKRILQQTRDGEVVNAWFAGVGPYPILLAANKDVECYAVEKNPSACEYLEENVYLNQVEDHVVVECGDVKKVAPRRGVEADRTLLPHPTDSFSFLPVAAQYTKPNGVMHVYTFAETGEHRSKAREAQEILRGHDVETRIENVAQCGTYSPGVSRICIDLRHTPA
jgi:tRNA (guanine37-N1)-methyltransferase